MGALPSPRVHACKHAVSAAVCCQAALKQATPSAPDANACRQLSASMPPSATRGTAVFAAKRARPAGVKGVWPGLDGVGQRGDTTAQSIPPGSSSSWTRSTEPLRSDECAFGCHARLQASSGRSCWRDLQASAAGSSGRCMKSNGNCSSSSARSKSGVAGKRRPSLKPTKDDQGKAEIRACRVSGGRSGSRRSTAT